MNAQKRLATLVALLALGNASAVSMKLAAVLPLTGPLSTLGSEAKKAIQLALKQRTPELQQLGLDVQWVFLDDANEPSRAPALVASVIRDPQIVGMIGPLSSGVTLKMGEQLVANPVAMVSAVTPADNLTEKGWNFYSRIAAPNSAQAQAASDYIANSLKAKSVFIVSDNQTFGNDLTNAVQKELNGTAVKSLGFAGVTGAADTTALATRITAMQPELVFFGGTFDEAALLLNALRAAGSQTLFMGGQTLATPDFVRRTVKNAPGTLYVDGFGQLTGYVNGINFVNAFAAEYQSHTGAGTAFSYDVANLLIDAAESVYRATGKLPTRDQMIGAVRKTNIPVERAVTGAISFTPSGERRVSPLFIMQIDKDSFAGGIKFITKYRPKN